VMGIGVSRGFDPIGLYSHPFAGTDVPDFLYPGNATPRREIAGVAATTTARWSALTATGDRHCSPTSPSPSPSPLRQRTRNAIFRTDERRLRVPDWGQAASLGTFTVRCDTPSTPGPAISPQLACQQRRPQSTPFRVEASIREAVPPHSLRANSGRPDGRAARLLLRLKRRRPHAAVPARWCVVRCDSFGRGV